MLQLRQLENVARRFPSEVETLRDLFQSVEASPRAVDSLAAVASRLREATAFRRDLASHLMIFAHGRTGPADLLGIVALAAADPASAAAANEADAHEVLRFILASIAANRGTEAPLTIAATQASSQWAWSIAAACVVTALLFGAAYMRHRAVAPFQQTQSAAELPPAVTPPSPSRDPQPEAVVTQPNSAPVPLFPFHQAAPSGTFRAETPLPRSTPYPTVTAQSKAVPSAQPLQEARTSPADLADKGPFTGSAQTRLSSPAVETRAVSSAVTRGAAPIATPAAVLSQRLDARPLPTNDPAIDQASGRAYPRLWRRHPAGTATPDTGESTTLLAANVPPSRPGTYAAPAAIAGTVRPVSLGTMAANVVYSPAPVYPTAAATARVQGQVTIQAEVDRDGSVASARVVSGPPLLRDAALDAVLRWRYHPRTVAGKPVTAAATAMVEFELP